MTLRWRFRYYNRDNPRNGVRHVFENADPIIRGRFLSRLRTLALLDFADWHDPLIKMLVGQDGLSEIRFKACGVQQRPLGFRSGENEYTLLLWATEKNNKFIPLSACEIARTRMAAVRADGRIADDLWLALE